MLKVIKFILFLTIGCSSLHADLPKNLPSFNKEMEDLAQKELKVDRMIELAACVNGDHFTLTTKKSAGAKQEDQKTIFYYTALCQRAFGNNEEAKRQIVQAIKGTDVKNASAASGLRDDQVQLHRDIIISLLLGQDADLKSYLGTSMTPDFQKRVWNKFGGQFMEVREEVKPLLAPSIFSDAVETPIDDSKDDVPPSPKKEELPVEEPKDPPSPKPASVIDEKTIDSEMATALRDSNARKLLDIAQQCDGPSLQEKRKEALSNALLTAITKKNVEGMNYQAKDGNYYNTSDGIIHVARSYDQFGMISERDTALEKAKEIALLASNITHSLSIASEYNSYHLNEKRDHLLNTLFQKAVRDNNFSDVLTVASNYDIYHLTKQRNKALIAAFGLAKKHPNFNKIDSLSHEYHMFWRYSKMSDDEKKTLLSAWDDLRTYALKMAIDEKDIDKILGTAHSYYVSDQNKERDAAMEEALKIAKSRQDIADLISVSGRYNTFEYPEKRNEALEAAYEKVTTAEKKDLDQIVYLLKVYYFYIFRHKISDRPDVKTDFYEDFVKNVEDYDGFKEKIDGLFKLSISVAKAEGNSGLSDLVNRYYKNYLFDFGESVKLYFEKELKTAEPLAK